MFPPFLENQAILKPIKGQNKELDAEDWTIVRRRMRDKDDRNSIKTPSTSTTVTRRHYIGTESASANFSKLICTILKQGHTIVQFIDESQNHDL